MRQGLVAALRPTIGIGLRLLALGLILVLGSARPVSANPAISYSTTYYDIVGLTASDLSKQMDLLGPKDDGGETGAADTVWAVDSQGTFRFDASKCRVESVRISATIQYRFPRWQNEPDGDAAMRQEWERFMTALRTHEAGHAEHGEEAARAVERALLALPARASCDAVQADAAATAKRIIERYQALDVDYDRTTRHGLSQGTYLKGESFGAIAFGPGRRAYSWVYGAETPAQAEQEALSSCAKMASDCRVVVDFSNGCGALALGAEGAFGAAQGARKDQAAAGALAACRRDTGGDCKLATSACATQ